MQSTDKEVRENALATLLSTTRFRSERSIVGNFRFPPASPTGKTRTIFDCRRKKVLTDAVQKRAEGEAENSDDSVNRAYDGLGKTYDFYKEVHDRNSIDDRGMSLNGYVHYGVGYDNAFWDGRQMVFGDGGGKLFQDLTKSLDVIAHELTHGVTEHISGLNYWDEPGALNESMSDVFGSLVKQWSLGQTAEAADWMIGADVWSPLVQGDCLRSMKEPGTAFNDPTLGQDPQVGHMDDYLHLPNTEEGDNGGVHENSGIPNKAFYLAAVQIGGNAWEAPGHIWFETLRSSGPDTKFQEFADKTSDTASRLYGTGSPQQQAIKAAWREVGIRISGPPPSFAGYIPGSTDNDTLAALKKQFDGLAKQFKNFKDFDLARAGK